MRRKSEGLTLIEVMIALVIMGIMIAIALPSFSTLMTKARVNSEINSVTGSMNFARSEATKRGQIVGVCPPNGTWDVATTCATGTDWSLGWLVVVTPAGSTQKVLLRSPGVSHGDVLTSATASTTSYPTFTPAGYTFWSGSLALQDVKNTTSLYQYICVKAGSLTKQVGVTCP